MIKIKLTELQNDIITLIVAGKTNAQIAADLNYSVEKIRKDLKTIYKYYGINETTLVKRAVLVREVVKSEMTKLML